MYRNLINSFIIISYIKFPKACFIQASIVFLDYIEVILMLEELLSKGLDS